MGSNHKNYWLKCTAPSCPDEISAGCKVQDKRSLCLARAQLTSGQRLRLWRPKIVALPLAFGSLRVVHFTSLHPGLSNGNKTAVIAEYRPPSLSTWWPAHVPVMITTAPRISTMQTRNRKLVPAQKLIIETETKTYRQAGLKGPSGGYLV